ncbi:porin [Paraburkholderia pallida]|uniref:Porin n=1 Tax=Paraburkholderia pallida TaxID=2547399 RepID=A0A4P7D695_9BURK|nr:porin [Paraburkholderia pallida]QBR04239.1 porin [Paraburkholderia pallida]
MTKLKCQLLVGGIVLGTRVMAFGQTSTVQLSGQIGSGVTWQNNQAGGGSAFSMTDNLIAASFMRISGAEDLGGGRQVLFRLESALNVSNGNAGGKAAGGTSFWNRQSYVGLASDALGRLTLGRQFTAATDTAIRTLDVFQFNGSSAVVVPMALFGVDRFASNDTRQNNTVKYSYGVPGIVDAGASYSFDDGVSGRNYSAGIAHTAGNYALAAMYTRYFDAVGTTPTGGVPEHSLWGLGGYYVFGPVKAYASWFQSALDATIAHRVGQRDNIFDLGLAWQIGNRANLRIAYYNDRGRDLDGVVRRDGTKQTVVIATEYTLSTRTSIYATVFQNRFSGGYKLETVNLAALNRSAGSSVSTGASVGVRHVF